MILFIRSILYVLAHPFDVVHYTVVRRYADAQKHFIGELYEGNGRTAKMIGMTCDNLPLQITNIDSALCWRRDFLAPMEADTIRVGGQTPKDNAHVLEYVALRRFCPFRMVILNRFVEHILESDYV